MNKITQNVKEYYGEILTNKDDLKTSACCNIENSNPNLAKYLANIHSEIKNKFYGCGSPIPSALKGKTVLDLGSGTGMDTYIVSQLVGSKGKVIGIDMTENQLKIANKYIDYHMNKFGYEKLNINFIKAYIEDLKAVGIENNSIDVVISNCVINLAESKNKVFNEIFRILKPGGELYFSDVFTDRRVPEHLINDKLLYGECLSGALYIEDFRRLLQKAGFLDYLVVTKNVIDIKDKRIKELVRDIKFYSITIRTFKCDFEDASEDYGHKATYLGTINDMSASFTLDDKHKFYKNKPLAINGNIAKILTLSRYSKYFNIEGDFSTHYGAFENKNTDSSSSECVSSNCCS